MKEIYWLKKKWWLQENYKLKKKDAIGVENNHLRIYGKLCK